MNSWQISGSVKRGPASVASSFSARVRYGKLRRAFQSAGFTVGDYTQGPYDVNLIQFNFTVAAAGGHAMTLFLLAHTDLTFRVTEL